VPIRFPEPEGGRLLVPLAPLPYHLTAAARLYLFFGGQVLCTCGSLHADALSFSSDIWVSPCRVSSLGQAIDVDVKNSRIEPDLGIESCPVYPRGAVTAQKRVWVEPYPSRYLIGLERR